jgi:hypothetical protein
MSVERQPNEVDPEDLARFEDEGGIQSLSYLDAAERIVKREVEPPHQVGPGEEMFSEGTPVPSEHDNGYSRAA